MQAIETVYKGYRFRSRLEARWAVFFDAVGMKYQYEPDGFEFEGEKYLPDFYLPEEDIFVEVKPDDMNRVDELVKAVKVCCNSTRRMLVLLSEIPEIKHCGYWMYNAFYYHTANRETMWRPIILRTEIDDSKQIKKGFFTTYFKISADKECRSFAWFTQVNERNPIFPFIGIDCFTFETGMPPDRCNEHWSTFRDESFYRVCDLENVEEYEFMKEAYKKARQARFEHGETPIC